MTLKVLQTSYNHAKIGRPHSHSTYLENNPLKSRTFFFCRSSCEGDIKRLEIRLDSVTSSASSHGSCLLGEATSPHCLQRLSRSVGWLHPTFRCSLVSCTYCIRGHQCTGSFLALKRKGSDFIYFFTVVFSVEGKEAAFQSMGSEMAS